MGPARQRQGGRGPAVSEKGEGGGGALPLGMGRGLLGCGGRGKQAREGEGLGRARPRGGKGWGKKDWAAGELAQGVFSSFFLISFCFLLPVPFSKEALKQNNQNKNSTYNTK